MASPRCANAAAAPPAPPLTGRRLLVAVRARCAALAAPGRLALVGGVGVVEPEQLPDQVEAGQAVGRLSAAPPLPPSGGESGPPRPGPPAREPPAAPRGEGGGMARCLSAGSAGPAHEA